MRDRTWREQIMPAKDTNVARAKGQPPAPQESAGAPTFRTLERCADEVTRILDDFGLGRGWSRVPASGELMTWARRVDITQGSKAQLAANPHMGWVHSIPEAQIKLLGVAEVLGAIGLVAPMAAGIAPFLTRAAAVCLATLMGGAVATHMIRREPAAVATALAVLTIVVATFR
jgi:hypothetical protein